MITRSERSGEKRNRIFSPGRRNRREKKLPFRLSFITKGDGGRVYPFTRFVNGEEAVLEESAGVSLVKSGYLAPLRRASRFPFYHGRARCGDAAPCGKD